MKVLVMLLLLMVVGCSVTEPKQRVGMDFEPKIVIIPKATFVEIQRNSSLTVAEALKIEGSYTEDVTERVLASVAELSEEMYFVCGGVYWEEDPQELDSMQLIGVTEKWIPINGTVTKVLHFQLKK